jgi:hypothetical protein
MRNKNTIEFLGLWENINNKNFNHIEFDAVKMEAGTNSFILPPSRWIKRINSIGIEFKMGKYGGTFAHQDIAMEFASWISVEFKLYFIKEFQRLKEKESLSFEQIEWNVKRALTKVNYQIHTDAIKENLIPKVISELQIKYIYSSEADVLNIALFGMTAKDWRSENPTIEGNI